MNATRRRLVTTLGIGIAISSGGSAWGQTTFYFCTDNGEWEADGDHFYHSFDGSTCSDPASDDPGSGDRVVIIPNITCVVDFSDIIGDLDVRSGAELVFPSGNTLNIQGISGDFTSTVDGTIRLQDDTSALLFSQNNQTIEGAGSIVGEISGAKILLGDEVQLTSTTTIEGILAITRSDFFDNTEFSNQGVVHANAAGTLSVNPDVIEDSSAGLWKVSGSGSVLTLDPRGGSASTLDGDFTVQAGTLDVENPGFDTTGTLTFTGGTIDCGGLTSSAVATFAGS